MAYHLYCMVPRESGGLDLNPGSATSKLVTVGKLLNLSVLICQMEILLHRPPGLLPRAKSIHIEQSAGHTQEPTQTSVLSLLEPALSIAPYVRHKCESFSVLPCSHFQPAGQYYQLALLFQWISVSISTATILVQAATLASRHVSSSLFSSVARVISLNNVSDHVIPTLSFSQLKPSASG